MRARSGECLSEQIGQRAGSTRRSPDPMTVARRQRARMQGSEIGESTSPTPLPVPEIVALRDSMIDTVSRRGCQSSPARTGATCRRASRFSRSTRAKSGRAATSTGCLVQHLGGLPAFFSACREIAAPGEELPSRRLKTRLRTGPANSSPETIDEILRCGSCWSQLEKARSRQAFSAAAVVASAVDEVPSRPASASAARVVVIEHAT